MNNNTSLLLGLAVLLAVVFLFVGLNNLSRTSNQLRRVALVLAVTVGTFLLDSLLVAYLWIQGVNLATSDMPVEPGESGFHVEPLLESYRWLLKFLLVFNIFILILFLIKRQYWHALGFTLGAVVPMGYLIAILISA